MALNKAEARRQAIRWLIDNLKWKDKETRAYTGLQVSTRAAQAGIFMQRTVTNGVEALSYWWKGDPDQRQFNTIDALIGHMLDRSPHVDFATARMELNRK